MPDFSKAEGGFGAGKVTSNYKFQLVVIEEWDDGVVSILNHSPLSLLFCALLFSETCVFSLSLLVGCGRQKPCHLNYPYHLQRDLLVIMTSTSEPPLPFIRLDTVYNSSPFTFP